MPALPPHRLDSVAVFCGSSTGTDEIFTVATRAFGRLLAERGIALVYGGGSVGLMGVLADAVLNGGGKVHGVITRALERKEVEHRGLASLQVVDTMHERKAAMADLASAFVMLPGGYGTFDEFFEAATWTQLGIHAKPCGVLEVDGFFAPLREFLTHATAKGFIRPRNLEMVVVESDPATLLDRLASWDGGVVDQLLKPSER